MKISVCFVLLVTLSGSAFAQNAIVNRQPEKPAWEIDLTDRLMQRNDGPSHRSKPGPPIPITETFRRAGRTHLLPAPGVGFEWFVPTALVACVCVRRRIRFYRRFVVSRRAGCGDGLGV